MISVIIESFAKTRQKIDNHKNYPEEPGIYAFYLADKSSLSDFGEGGRVIYVGIAKDSLHDRDLNQHFKSGKSGSSTLRRSIGAILKDELKLTSIPRGRDSDKKRFDYYKFLEEESLTKWMKENLEIGYWVSDKSVAYVQLRNIEKEVIMELQPILDLDNRTRRFNPFANRINEFKEICKRQAGKQ